MALEMKKKTGNLWPDELKILAVDDEQDIVNLIRFSLEPAGFRVIRTTKPSEGLSLAISEQPDLLLLDIMMPEFDGFELLRRVRRHPSMSDVPVIVISARASTSDRLRMLQLSEIEADKIDAYLGKPFDPAVLLNTVKNVLVKHKDYLVSRRAGVTKPWDSNQMATAYH